MIYSPHPSPPSLPPGQRLYLRGQAKRPPGQREMHAWEKKGLRPARERRWGKHACSTGTGKGFTDYHREKL